MAYHIQRMQENGFKREEMEKSTYDYRGQDGTHCECKNTEAHKNTCDSVESIFLRTYLKIIL